MVVNLKITIGNLNLNIFKYLGLLTLGILTPSVSYAYVDPGSGSVIVTAILGFAAAISYTCRKYFYQLKRIVLGGKSESDAHASDHQSEDR